MKHSKLVKAISELSAWELRHLSDFVHSPFFNKHERLTELLDLIVMSAPAFNEENLDRQVIYQKVFLESRYDEQKFKDLLSLGMKLFKSFLSYSRIRQDEFTQGLALMEALAKGTAEAEFNKTNLSMEKVVAQQPGQVQEKALRKLRLQEINLTFLGKSKNRKADDSVQVAAKFLDNYYLLYRLKLAVEMANRRNVVGQESDLGMLVPLLAYLRSQPEVVENNPGIHVYHTLYRLLSGNEEGNPFDELIETIGHGISDFEIAERRDIYAYAINFCIQQINRGKDTYLSNMLDLYERALEDETLLNEGWLSQWDYKNIVSAGLRAKRFDWCAQFIDHYKGKIEPSARENAYTYNQASLHLEQGDYKSALKLLQHVEFSDQFYHLGAKVMLLKSYYELQEHEALLHLCETFRMYLKRQTDLSKYHQTTNMNLIALTRKLADLQSRWPDLGRKERVLQLEKIRVAIEEKGNVAQKAWLLQKIDALVLG